MNNYTRSKKSTQDIREITKRSVEDFGVARTLEYMAGLKECSCLQTVPILGVDLPIPVQSSSTCFSGMKAMLFITESARVIFLLSVSSIQKCFRKNISNCPFPVGKTCDLPLADSRIINL